MRMKAASSRQTTKGQSRAQEGRPEIQNGVQSSGRTARRPRLDAALGAGATQGPGLYIGAQTQKNNSTDGPGKTQIQMHCTLSRSTAGWPTRRWTTRSQWDTRPQNLTQRVPRRGMQKLTLRRLGSERWEVWARSDQSSNPPQWSTGGEDENSTRQAASSRGNLCTNAFLILCSPDHFRLTDTSF